jgi:hypothetical protein
LILPVVNYSMSIEFNFTPELHLIDGRIIRNIKDAIAFAREQEVRPGVDRRDEVLHALERARDREEAHAAAHLFLRCRPSALVGQNELIASERIAGSS